MNECTHWLEQNEIWWGVYLIRASKGHFVLSFPNYLCPTLAQMEQILTRFNGCDIRVHAGEWILIQFYARSK